MSNTIRVNYVTSSDYKRDENLAFVENVKLRDGTPVKDLFEFKIHKVPIGEALVVDLEAMVLAEAAEAYRQVMVPCIVEHAGLIFSDYLNDSYPGGLTKPMWNTLGDRFTTETNSSGRSAIARAVVAYCDGKTIKTFTGETEGKLASAPRGTRDFYWDTIFQPTEHEDGGATYAEIVEDPAFGLAYKMTELSQSARAMLRFLEFLRSGTNPDLWP